VKRKLTIGFIGLLAAVIGPTSQSRASTLVGSCSASSQVATIVGPSCGFVVSCPAGSAQPCGYSMRGEALAGAGVVSVKVVADNTSNNAGCLGTNGFCATADIPLSPVPPGQHVAVFCLWNAGLATTVTINCLVHGP
jgi:hypothetical protein